MAKIIFYRHSITTRIKTIVLIIFLFFSEYSIVIPLQQGLRLQKHLCKMIHILILSSFHYNKD